MFARAAKDHLMHGLNFECALTYVEGCDCLGNPALDEPLVRHQGIIEGDVVIEDRKVIRVNFDLEIGAVIILVIGVNVEATPQVIERGTIGIFRIGPQGPNHGIEMGCSRDLILKIASNFDFLDPHCPELLI